MMGPSISRREFLAQTALLTASGLLYARPLEALERVGVGVVGLDAGGRRCLDALALAGDARIVALCDRRADRLNGASRHPASHPLARLETDAWRVIADPGVEAVILAAGSSTPRLLRDACSAGKDIYVTAPLTLDARLASRLATEAGLQRRVVQHGTVGASDPAFLDAVARCAAGAVGALRGVRIRAEYTGPTAKDGWTTLLDELHLVARLFGAEQPKTRHSLRAPLPPAAAGRASLATVEVELGGGALLVQLQHRPAAVERLAAHVTILGDAHLEFTSERACERGRPVYEAVEQARHLRNFLCCARECTPDRLAAAPGPAAAGAIALRAVLAAA